VSASWNSNLIGLSQRSYATPDPVSAGMADRLRRAYHLGILTGRPSRPTQPSTLSGTGNEYQQPLRCGCREVKAGIRLIPVVDKRACHIHT